MRTDIDPHVCMHTHVCHMSMFTYVHKYTHMYMHAPTRELTHTCTHMILIWSLTVSDTADNSGVYSCAPGAGPLPGSSENPVRQLYLQSGKDVG